MKKRQEIDESKLIGNPYISKLVIEATKVVESGMYINDQNGVPQPVERLIEKQKYAKVFYCTGCKERVYNLSAGAKSLYLYIIYNLKANKDWIHINREWYMSKNGIKSINTNKDAVKELSRYEFLCLNAEYKDLFWINPALFFTGDRIKKFRDRVIIDNKWEK